MSSLAVVCAAIRIVVAEECFTAFVIASLTVKYAHPSEAADDFWISVVSSSMGNPARPESSWSAAASTTVVNRPYFHAAVLLAASPVDGPWS